MQLIKNRKFWFLTGTFLIFLTLVWFIKTLYFVNELDLSAHKKYNLISSAGFSLILTSILIFKKGRFNIFLSFLIYFILSFLFYADVVYERYYDSILHIELVGQANQLGDVGDSIISLIYKTDYLYWIDIPVVLLAVYLVNKRLVIKKNPWKSAAMLTAGIIIILLISFIPLKASFSDQYKVALTGIIPTHLFDMSHTVYNKTFASEPVIQDQNELKKLKENFKMNQELQKKSPYYGKFKGKNLIIVQAESLNTFPIGIKVNGQEVTPNINSLINESHYYPNIYLGIGRGNTSDAEFVANNSIYPMAQKGIYKTYPQNDYLSLANLLKESGYHTSATHGNTPDFWNRKQAYKNQGFLSFYHKEHPLIKENEIIGLGISDKSIFKQMVNIYKDKKDPFYNFIVTLTNHRPFEMPEQYNYIDLPSEISGTATGNYLQSVKYFDEALGLFIEDLKKEGLWEETIFVMYGDHYGPIPNDAKEIKDLLNVKFDQKTQFNIPLIIHHPGQKDGVVNEVVGSQMDIYPTLTSLLGIEKPLVQFGLPLDVELEGFAGFAYETTRYTFYSNKYDYIAAHDGLFKSGTCIENETGQPTDVEACRKGYNKLFKDIETSTYLLENNLITNIFDKK